MAPEPSAHEAPVAGWYPDPENPQMARYWDGSQWTDDRRPLVSKEGVSGWLLFFGYAGAILLPIVGLIIGIALLVKKATGHGVAVLAISIATFALGFAIATSGASRFTTDMTAGASFTFPTETLVEGLIAQFCPFAWGVNRVDTVTGHATRQGGWHGQEVQPNGL